MDEAKYVQCLSGKKVAITGGFGFLGRSVGALLAAQGASVALLDKASVPVERAVDGDVHWLGGIDLSQGDAARQAMAAAVAALGGLDALVNVAGGFRWETVEAGSIDTWDTMYQMNVRTTLLASQAALPHLLARGAGRIVNIGALASQQASTGMGAYAASKAGVSRLTEALAEELKDKGINVNAVLPSIIDTPVNRADMPGADATRWVQPTQLAQVVSFLLQDASAAVTGALIPVRGRV